MVHIFLSTPCYGGLCLESYAGGILMLQRLCIEKDYKLFIDTTENESLVQRARNMSVARFMANPAFTHYMSIDADIHFDPQAVINLIESGLEFAVAVYPKKCIMWEQGKKGILENDDRPMDLLTSALVANMGTTGKIKIKDGFIKVLDGPTGFMMFEKSVTEKMYKEYKDTLYCVNDHHDSTIKDYIAVFDCMIDPDSKRYLSEDYAFCRRWQQIGGEIYADVRTTLGHVGNLSFTASMEERFKDSELH